MRDLAKALRDVEFFQGMADEQIDGVAAISKLVEFPAYHVIFHEDEPAEDVFIVTGGRISLAFCAPKVGCCQLMEVG
ncbi:MAG TPA: hypothetical protein VGH32_01310, partial [Pirellulales bacterium]